MKIFDNLWVREFAVCGRKSVYTDTNLGGEGPIGWIILTVGEAQITAKKKRTLPWGRSIEGNSESMPRRLRIIVKIDHFAEF